MRKSAITLLTSLTLLFASQYTLAQNNQQGPSGNQGPPLEAITACEGQNAGDAGEFSGRNGETITGICEEMDGQLILRPDNAPSNGGGQNNQSGGQDQSSQSSGDRQGPPPEAFTACEGKNEGDTAQFEGQNGDYVSGSCKEMNGNLVLVPEGGRR